MNSIWVQDYPDLEIFTPEYLNLLQAIQNRFNSPLAQDKMENLMRLIQQTGCFAVNSDSFDFDLCLLDKQTVKKIQRVLDIQI